MRMRIEKVKRKRKRKRKMKSKHMMSGIGGMEHFHLGLLVRGNRKPCLDDFAVGCIVPCQFIVCLPCVAGSNHVAC